MYPSDINPMAEFNKLFGELLRAVEEDHELRSTTPSLADLVVMRDRLQELRSRLANARCELQRSHATDQSRRTETSTPVGRPRATFRIGTAY